MEEVKPMTVKYIVTRYVEADAAQFKSVVQSLTGKDSTAADEAPASLQTATGSRCQTATSTLCRRRQEDYGKGEATAS
ncbi:hypothetical protein ABZP36_013492 [Zizania latifolia]